MKSPKHPDCERHFAFFAQADGRWCREWRGLVDAPPPLRSGQSRAARRRALTAWLLEVSGVEVGEIALDVTHCGWPVGDFVWAHFDAIAMRVTWPERHAFLVIEKSSLQIVGHTESPRPVRSNDRHHVVDLTGTVLAPWLYEISGRFLLSARSACFVAADDNDRARRIESLVSACAPHIVATLAAHQSAALPSADLLQLLAPSAELQRLRPSRVPLYAER